MHTMFMLTELNFNFRAIFLVEVITRYIKIRYGKSQNVNFLALIRSCILLASIR